MIRYIGRSTVTVVVGFLALTGAVFVALVVLEAALGGDAYRDSVMERRHD